jgi:uncharacterized damage-inducible protein DinB
VTDADGSLLPFYRGWETHNATLIAAIAPLTDEQLAIRPGGLRGEIWRVAAHIAGCRAYWFHAWMGEGDAALLEYDQWHEADTPRSAGELVTALTKTWALIHDCLSRWTPAMLADEFEPPGDERLSRQWITWHVLEHDIHHGGEISATLGANGIAGLEL